MHVETIDDPFDLGPLAASIRSSSNFRFAWRFFQIPGRNLQNPGTVAAVLNQIIEDSLLHSFLSDSWDDDLELPFQIEPLHRHASIALDESDFLDTMTRASLDRLGAYSRSLARSTGAEREVVNKLFSKAGPYLAFAINSGSQPDCDVCRHHNNRLFSNWFFGVAWDWTFLVTWPLKSVLWMGCLTDTD